MPWLTNGMTVLTNPFVIYSITTGLIAGLAMAHARYPTKKTKRITGVLVGILGGWFLVPISLLAMVLKRK